MVVFVVEDGAVNDDVEQPPVFGQPLGLKIVDDLLPVEPREPLARLGFAVFRNKRDDFPLQLREGPAEDAFKSGVQIGDRAVQVEDKDRVRQEIKEGAVALFRLAARLGKLQGTLLRFPQRALGQMPVGDVPGDSPKPERPALFVDDQLGGDLQEAPFGIRAGDLPGDVRHTAAFAENPVEGIVGDPGIFLVHEIRVVAIQDGLARVTKNPAERVIEELEVTAKVRLVEAVRHIFDQGPIAFLFDFSGILLCRMGGRAYSGRR